jgi:peptidoglycan/xylan/chitin deacetylase (PgdA/CDA1 family)
MLARFVQALRRRIPAHARDRLEAAWLPRREFEHLALPAQAALTVICDDGELKDLEIVETLERAGAKGVFAVSPDLIGRPGFLTYDQLRAIRAAGHEIAFHGTTHDPFTGFAGPEALSAAVQAGLARLEGEGLGAARTLIYPYGSTNRWVRQTVAPLFDCAFTTWFGVNEGRTNRYAIRRVAFGAYTGKQPASEAWYRGLVERCHGGGWPALMLHPAASGHTNEHTALLGRLLAYAKAVGLPVRTVAAHLTHAPLAGAGTLRSGPVA